MNKRGIQHVEKNAVITRTAAMLALLIALQAVAKSAGPFVTGSVPTCATLLCGFASGRVVALVSPFLAFLLGIGPKLIEVVPAIAIGNLVLVVILWALKGETPLRRALQWLGASAGKFLALYLPVVQLLCRVLPIPEKLIQTFPVFSAEKSACAYAKAVRRLIRPDIDG